MEYIGTHAWPWTPKPATEAAPRVDLARFVKHAERFGTDQVFETAAETMDAVGLGQLALALRRVNRKWRMEPVLQRRLIADLAARGESDKQIARMAGCAERTVRNWR